MIAQSALNRMMLVFFFLFVCTICAYFAAFFPPSFKTHTNWDCSNFAPISKHSHSSFCLVTRPIAFEHTQPHTYIQLAPIFIASFHSKFLRWIHNGWGFFFFLAQCNVSCLICIFSIMFLFFFSFCHPYLIGELIFLFLDCYSVEQFISNVDYDSPLWSGIWNEMYMHYCNCYGYYLYISVSVFNLFWTWNWEQPWFLECNKLHSVFFHNRYFYFFLIYKLVCCKMCSIIHC